MHVFIETMCSDLEPGPYLKGQYHTGQLKVRVHMLVPSVITYSCIDGIPYNLVQMLFFLFETLCNDIDSGTYFKVQGHATHLKVRVNVLVSVL